MSYSAADHDEAKTLEAVPLELLPLHQGLEEDGNSWRATLPRPDNLLRRVAVTPQHEPQHTDTADPIRPSGASGASGASNTPVSSLMALLRLRRRKPTRT